MQAKSQQKWLELHGLEHWTHYYTDYGRTLQKQFFDHFLRGDDNGWDKQPRRCYSTIRHPDGSFELREEAGLAAAARPNGRRFHLDASGGRSRA